MVTCQFCQKPMMQSMTLVPGRTVNGCRGCGTWYVVGVGEVVMSGYNLGSRLQATIPVVPEKKKAAYDPDRLDWSRLDWE